MWLDVPGWEGLYRVSDAGEILSVRSGRLLSASRRTGGYPSVVLCRSGERAAWQVHRLVLTTFVGPCPEGLEGCHENDVRDDNRLTNLRWGTRSQNTWDKIRNGNHPFARRSHCSAGHEYTAENTYRRPNGTRQCRECMRGYRKKSDFLATAREERKRNNHAGI